MKKYYLLLLLLLQYYSTLGQVKKIAIVFGMSKYSDEIGNCKNDADSMAIALNSIGFEVIEKLNVPRRSFLDEINAWSSMLPLYDLALFYFSGHGAEVNGANYLFPIKANINDEADVADETISLTRILEKMELASQKEGSRLKCSILVLDACRDNPFTKSWSKSLGDNGGLVIPNDIPDGTFIGFATKPGKRASAVGRYNSPYTQAILKHIRTTNRSLDGIFNDVNATTRYLTGGKQTPFKHSSLDRDYFFSGSIRQHTPGNPLDVTKSATESMRDVTASTNIKKLLTFIDFDSSIDDLIVAEYGSKYSGSVKYESLPKIDQCPAKELRYYWRKLSESSANSKIYSFLQKNDLMKFATDDSYIIYSFYNNKLYSVIVRIFFNDIVLHQRLGEALFVNLEKYPSQFYTENGDNFMVYSLAQNINETTLGFAKKGTESFCFTDWWSVK
jgi:hypothetical protein